MKFQKEPPKMDKKSLTESIAEAESAPMKFEPSTRSKFIKENIEHISEYKKNGLDDKEIFKQCSEFAEQFPELFKKILSGDDISTLNTMLQMLDKMGEGKLSQHQASVVIGKKLANDFITPIVNK
jgi:bacterioferritin (cytochrome b1)